jgi:hypothetical protein
MEKLRAVGGQVRDVAVETKARERDVRDEVRRRGR